MDPNRESRYLPCDGFRILGGRKGVPGKIQEVPWFVWIPGWFSEEARAQFKDRGFTPLRVNENRMLAYDHANNRVYGEDIFVFSLDCDYRALEAVVAFIWRVALQMKAEE